MPAEQTFIDEDAQRRAAAEAAAVLADVPREPGAAKPDPILVGSGIIRRFGGLTAVDHVDLARSNNGDLGAIG